jgi:hypothetical protein
VVPVAEVVAEVAGVVVVVTVVASRLCHETFREHCRRVVHRVAI